MSKSKVKSKTIATKKTTKTAETSRNVTVEDDVLPFAKKKGIFSTGDVVEEFGVSFGSATSLVAIMRIKRVIEHDGKAADETSRWKYVG